MIKSDRIYIFTTQLLYDLYQNTVQRMRSQQWRKWVVTLSYPL